MLIVVFNYVLGNERGHICQSIVVTPVYNGVILLINVKISLHYHRLFVLEATLYFYDEMTVQGLACDSKLRKEEDLNLESFD